MVGIYVNDKNDFKEAITDLVALGYDVTALHALTGISEKKLISWFDGLGVPSTSKVNHEKMESFMTYPGSDKESAGNLSITLESKQMGPKDINAPFISKRKYSEAFKPHVNSNGTFDSGFKRNFSETKRTPLGSKEWLSNLVIEESTDEEKSDSEQEHTNTFNKEKSSLSSSSYQSFILMKNEQNKRLEELKKKIMQRELVIRNKSNSKSEISTTNVDKMNVILKTKKEILAKKIQISKVSQSLQDVSNEIQKNEEKVSMSRQQIKQIRKYIKQFKSQINESKNVSFEFQNKKRILEDEIRALENELNSNTVSFKSEQQIGTDDGLQKLAKRTDLTEAIDHRASQDSESKEELTQNNEEIKFNELSISENQKIITFHGNEIHNNVGNSEVTKNEQIVETSSERLTRFIVNNDDDSLRKIKTSHNKNDKTFPLINTINHKLVSAKDIDYSKPFCSTETSGGICNDPSCEFQHFKIVEITTEMIAEEINKKLQFLTTNDRETREEELRIFLERNVERISNNHSLLRLIYDFFSD